MRFRALAALLLAPMIMAQGSVELSRTTVAGFVRIGNRPVSNASVFARSNAERQTTRTDSKGHYIFFSLSAGTYVISAQSGHLRTCAPAHEEVQAGFHYDVTLHVSRRC